MKNYFLLYILNIFLILVFLTPIKNVFQSSLNYILSPLTYVVSSTYRSVDDTFVSIQNLFAYKYKYDSLNTDYLNLKSSIEVFSLDKKYTLDSEIYAQQDLYNHSKTIIAYIVGGKVQNNSFLLKLNRGTSSNISVGDTVIYKNYLIGKVISVERDISYCEVFFMSETKTPVYGKKNNSESILNCKQGNCELSNLLNNSPLEEGETLLTSGFLDSFQKGFIAGSVLKIYSSGENVFKRADIKQEVDIRKISNVGIITYEK